MGTPLSEPAAFLLQKAVLAHFDGLTEAQFFADRSTRVLGRGAKRTPRILNALAEVQLSGHWPW
jgi:hypothetical protein